MESHSSIQATRYLPDLILNYIFCLLAGGFGLLVLLNYGPTAEISSDASVEEEEIEDWPMLITIIYFTVILTLPLLTATFVAHSPGFLNKMLRFIFWLFYPKIVTANLFAVVGNALYNNQDSSDTNYVDTWPAIVFMALATACIVMGMGIIKYRNGEKYTQGLMRASGMVAENSLSESAPLNINSQSDDKTPRLLTKMTSWRVVGSVVSIWIFSLFSLKYGLTTTERVNGDDFLVWGVLEVFYLVSTLILFRTWKIDKARLDSRLRAQLSLWPEYVAIMVFIVNFCVICWNYVTEDKMDYWPTGVATLHLVQVLFTTAYMP